MRRYYIVAVHYHGEGFAIIGLLERSGTTHQHVENDAKAPNVNRRSVVGIAEKDFRCRIGKRATAGEESLARVEFVGEPKVGQLDHPQLFEEDHILRFQVTMDNVELVTVLDGSDDLERNTDNMEKCENMYLTKIFPGPILL